MAGRDPLLVLGRGQIRAEVGKLVLDAAQPSDQASGGRGRLQQSTREPDARGKLVHGAQTLQPLRVLGHAPPAGKPRLPAIAPARVDPGQAPHPLYGLALGS